MDRSSSSTPSTADSPDAAQAVLVEVQCSWLETNQEPNSTLAVIVHAGSDMLVLEAADATRALPPMGTAIHVVGDQREMFGRLAEHGRAGRFLVSVGNRPVRRDLRLRVSLSGMLRSPLLANPVNVEIDDLATGGARVRGVELPEGSLVALDFTPPGRDEPVTVRARVAHTTDSAEHPWLGLVFRLVALRGGR